MGFLVEHYGHPVATLTMYNHKNITIKDTLKFQVGKTLITFIINIKKLKHFQIHEKYVRHNSHGLEVQKDKEAKSAFKDIMENKVINYCGIHH